MFCLWFHLVAVSPVIGRNSSFCTFLFTFWLLSPSPPPYTRTLSVIYFPRTQSLIEFWLRAFLFQFPIDIVTMTWPSCSKHLTWVSYSKPSRLHCWSPEGQCFSLLTVNTESSHRGCVKMQSKLGKQTESKDMVTHTHTHTHTHKHADTRTLTHIFLNDSNAKSTMTTCIIKSTLPKNRGVGKRE